MKSSKPDGRKRLGTLGEDAAAAYLQEQQYLVVDRNWRCRSGEIDLVADKDGLLVFVEVRSRRNTGRFGTPRESVNAAKQLQVRQTVQYYLTVKGMHERQVRFDVIGVHFSKEGLFEGIDHVQNAF